MNNQDEEVLVYLMTGFLESGKTQFLDFTLKQDYFQVPGITLLILCEEGEEEYDPEEMKAHRVVIETVEDQEDLTTEWLNELNEKYSPERVVIEYNGMWRVSEFEAMDLPESWVMEQKLTTVDASTFQVYLSNMKPLFVEMITGTDMVFFNRCTDIEPLAGFRRSVKVVSPQAEVIFEDEEGEIEDIFGDTVPYDMDADIVEIPAVDYGIWFLDVTENQDRYNGKVIKYTAKVQRPKGFPKDAFALGRQAMTCCADDLTFLGYVCKAEDAEKYKTGDWVTLTAKIGYSRLRVYDGVGPVLHAIKIEKAEPIEELVYFN